MESLKSQITFKASQILRIRSGILLTTDGWHCGPGNATWRASAIGEYGCSAKAAMITHIIAVLEKGNDHNLSSRILAAYVKYIYAFCTYNILSSIEYEIQSHPHFFIAKSPQSKRTLLNVQPPRPTTLRQSQTLKVICLIPTLNRSLPICTSRCCEYLHEKSRWWSNYLNYIDH